jgi:hypothetical protein
MRNFLGLWVSFVALSVFQKKKKVCSLPLIPTLQTLFTLLFCVNFLLLLCFPAYLALCCVGIGWWFWLIKRRNHIIPDMKRFFGLVELLEDNIFVDGDVEMNSISRAN